MKHRDMSEKNTPAVPWKQSTTRRAMLGFIGAVTFSTFSSSGITAAASAPEEIDPPLVHEQDWEPVRPTFSEPPTHEQSWTPVRPELSSEALTHQQPWAPERPQIQSSPTHVEIWTEGPAPNPITGAQPTDPDGDGLYEGINGNGEFDISDVQGLFALLDSDKGNEYLNNNVEYFDFNDNGVVDIWAVQALFVELLESQ
jgi:PKD repeat protein